jgi:hypothetical protein
MSFVAFASASCLPWNTCPAHGYHGCARCPFCTAGREPELAIVHAPLLMPPSSTPGSGMGGGDRTAAELPAGSPTIRRGGLAG